MYYENKYCCYRREKYFENKMCDLDWFPKNSVTNIDLPALFASIIATGYF